MAWGTSSISVSSAFADFFTTTTKKTFSDAGKFFMEFQKRSYFCKKLMKGKSAATSFQNGSEIQDFVIFDEGGTGQLYDPNGTLVTSMPQGIVGHSVPWTFRAYDLSWTKHELALQTGGRDRDGQFAVFKRVYSAKRAMLFGRFANTTEGQCWAVPDKTRIETKTGALPQVPYPVNASVNEFSNGLYPSYTPGGAWTTKQGIDPTVRTSWVPVQKTYLDDVQALAVGESYDLFSALDIAFIQTKYETLPFASEDVNDTPNSTPQIIATSEQGLANVMEGLRRANNFTRMGGQDPAYPNPVWGGREIMSVQALNTAPIFPNAAGTALVAESDSTVVGRSGAASTVTAAPRFFLLNTDAMAMIWHSENYFDPSEKDHPFNQPYSYTIWYDTWGNLFFRSIRHHACIYPGGALS